MGRRETRHAAATRLAGYLGNGGNMDEPNKEIDILQEHIEEEGDL